jgi:sec-independent protein translocase protein TatB
MFDIGWTEMLVIGVIAIVVVGPKDLPALLRGVGRIVRQMRGLAREFQGGVEEFIREAELDEVKKSIHHVSNFDPTSHPDFRPDTNSDSKPEPAADTPDPGATQKGKVEKGDAEKSKAGKSQDAGAKQKKQSAEKSGPAGEDGKGDGA